MKFVKVDELPNSRGRHSLRIFLEEFMSENIKTAKVEFKDGEYASPKVARSCIHTGVKKAVLPIDVKLIDDEIYLIRRDI